jgi:hypothetical protein
MKGASVGIKEDYQKAVELAKEGNLEEAQALLTTIDHPKAVTMLAKVNAAIATRGKTKPKASPQKSRAWLSISILFLLIAVSLAYYGLVYIPGQEQAAVINRLLAMKRHCSETFISDAIEQNISDEGYTEACNQEVDYVLNLYADEIDYCLEQSQDGALNEQFKNCLEENAVYFTGTYIRQATK